MSSRNDRYGARAWIAMGLAIAAGATECRSSRTSAGDGRDASTGDDAGGAPREADGSSNATGIEAGDSPGASSDGVADAPASDASALGDAAVGAGGVLAGGVRWIGRVDASNPRAVKFAWSGAGFVATVRGTKISVILQTEGASSAFFQPVIDGTPGPRFQVMTGAAQTVVLGSGLSASDHVVELYRDSEGMYGDDIFAGFADGTPGVPPPATGRLIEIIGDSISAGYGNLGSETHPPWTNTCTFSLDTESAYKAYGALLGRALSAEVSIIARSGWGVYRDNTGNTSNVLSSVYANTLGTQTAPAWSFARQADAVVINLGTNDSSPGDPGTPYEVAYVAFLRTVRSHYPRAWIFLTIGPMTSDPLLTQMRTHLTNVVAALGDSRVTTVDLATQDATMTGCDFHPDTAEDAIMANALAPTLKAKLGW